MSKITDKQRNLALRKARVRSTVIGTSEQPRLSVVISNRSVSVQLINDSVGKTLASSSSLNLKAKGSLTEQASEVGKDIAVKAKKLKITKVSFDRNGRSYQQRLNALASSARENGLEF